MWKICECDVTRKCFANTEHEVLWCKIRQNSRIRLQDLLLSRAGRNSETPDLSDYEFTVTFTLTMRARRRSYENKVPYVISPGTLELYFFKQRTECQRYWLWLKLKHIISPELAYPHFMIYFQPVSSKTSLLSSYCFCRKSHTMMINAYLPRTDKVENVRNFPTWPKIFEEVVWPQRHSFDLEKAIIVLGS